MKKFWKLLLVFLFLFTSVSRVTASSLIVTCPGSGTECETTPANTPLFSQKNILPGDRFYSQLEVKNRNEVEDCELILNTKEVQSEQLINLAKRIFLAITDGGTNYFGTLIFGKPSAAVSLFNLYESSNVSLGVLSAGSSKIFNWYADFDPLAGNDYQATKTKFDLFLNLSCEEIIEPTPTPTPSDDGGDDNGGGKTTPANPPVCHNQAPVGAVNLIVTNLGPNTVQLNWTGDPQPRTHYALEFYRQSDGAPYGATNIGNGNSYLVTNLSGGGASYRFFIRAINGCAPGELSNEEIITPTGGVVAGRPVGQAEGGQAEILGSSTPEEVPVQVLGETTCGQWQFYLPWILLIVQGLLIIIIYFLTRKNNKKTKQYLALGITLLSIALFYWLRECQCYANLHWFLAWVCKWYFILAILLTGLLQAINYGFLEETERS